MVRGEGGQDAWRMVDLRNKNTPKRFDTPPLTCCLQHLAAEAWCCIHTYVCVSWRNRACTKSLHRRRLSPLCSIAAVFCVAYLSVRVLFRARFELYTVNTKANSSQARAVSRHICIFSAYSLDFPPSAMCTFTKDSTSTVDENMRTVST